MNALIKSFSSTVGKKIILGLSGLGLVVFLIGHLAGNLLLYLPEGTAFNRYADNMMSLGPLLIVIEGGLAFVILLHAILAIRVTLKNKGARASRYEVSQTKGGPSKGSFGSRNMILTGAVLLAFTILHVLQFRLGPGIEAGYTALVDGKEVRDLHSLVVETFQNPLWVLLYLGVLIFMALHVRHGFWSAFQSLGVAYPKYTGLIYSCAYFLAAVLAIGFIGIPLWLFFDGPSLFY